MNNDKIKTTCEFNVLFENREFYGIQNDFDLARGIMSFKTTKDGGSYLTCIPISDFLYRRKYPTKAKVYYHEFFDNYGFVIKDDWGHYNYLRISKSIVSKYWIKKQIENCVAFGLTDESELINL